VVPAPGRRRAPGQSVSAAVVAAVAAVVLAVGGVTAYVIVRHHPSTLAAAPAHSPSAAASKPTSTASASASHSAASSPTPTPTPTTNAKITATGWDDTTVHPVTTPVAIGNVVAVYTADGGQLTMRAIDPASGATLWSHPASTAQSTPGATFAIAYLGNVVFFYVTAADPTLHLAEIAAVDAVTGKQQWVTDQPISYADMPALCSDKAALCDSAYAANDQSQEIRTNLATGAQSLLSSSAGRSLGTGLWDAGVRTPEYIEHLDDVTGRLVWKDAVDPLFGTPVSSDDGWNWDTYGDVYVGWLGGTRSATSHTITLNGDETVGIRASDGVRLWRHPGLYGCPIQGLTDAAGQPFAVRCIATGSVTFDAAGGSPTSSRVDVTVQGFDVHTGATLWSDHLGNAPGALGIGSDKFVRLTGEVFAVTNAAGHTTTINLKTGATSTPAAGATGWCVQDDGTFTIDGVAQADGSPVDYSASGLVAPCTPTGASAPAADGSSTGDGATAGGYFVWASKDGLHAFAIGD